MQITNAYNFQRMIILRQRQVRKCILNKLVINNEYNLEKWQLGDITGRLNTGTLEREHDQK